MYAYIKILCYNVLCIPGPLGISNSNMRHKSLTSKGSLLLGHTVYKRVNPQGRDCVIGTRNLAGKFGTQVKESLLDGIYQNLSFSVGIFA